MPILDVEIVEDPGTVRDTALAHDLADAVGPIIGMPPGHTWIRLRRLSSTDYAEHGVREEATPRPVFVTVLCRRVPEGHALVTEIGQLTLAIATACRRPTEHVHVLYAPPVSGRVAFGGILVGAGG